MRRKGRETGAAGLAQGVGASIACAALLLCAAPDALARGTTQSPPTTANVSGNDVSPRQPEVAPLDVPSPPPGVSLPQVDPIIPDEEFKAAIPPLDASHDPELDKALESIADFERNLAAKPAPDAGASPPAAVAASSVADPDIDAPLPALDQFQLAPVQFAQAEPDDKDAQVAYRTKINGLESADRQTGAHLGKLFRELSALKPGDRKAANIAMVSARLSDDSVLMQRILASEGWYDARVTTRVDRSAAADGLPLTAVIDVVPGKRFSLGSITVNAAPTVPVDLIARNLALRVGEPIVADRIQGAEAQVSLALPQNGYPFAKVGQRDILLDPASGLGDYTLPVSVGPRARFGGFATDGDLAFGAKHVEVLARFKRGELYDSRKMDDLRQALVATGLFASVSAEPVATGQSAGDDTEYVTVQVHQDAGPPRTIAGTLGYATGEGFKATASWTHRNLFRPEGALIVHGVAGTKEQSAGVTFRRSNAGRRDRTFEVVAEALHSQYEAFSAYTGRLAATMSYASTPIWQKKLTYAYGVQLLASAEKDYDFQRMERVRKTYYVGGLTGQVGLDLSDNLLNPTKGARVTALVEPEGALKHGFHPYVRARIDASGYYPVNDSLVLAGRVRLGTIQGANLAEIPPSRRLYAGGGGSVRGYAYQKLGELDPKGNPIGGRSLNEASAEVRYRFGNFGVVGFVDAGQSYRSDVPKFSDIRYGVGVGGRYYTNFGPMRLDVATPINRRKGESRINIYVSIGQAF